jgi:hypothetical protein
VPGPLWAVLGWGDWAAGGLLHGQVSPGKAPFLLFSVYLFSIFYFIDLNTVLNSTIFCKYD